MDAIHSKKTTLTKISLFTPIGKIIRHRWVKLRYARLSLESHMTQPLNN